MDHDPDLRDPSGRWRLRGGVGGASAGPLHRLASFVDHDEESLVPLTVIVLGI